MRRIILSLLLVFTLFWAAVPTRTVALLQPPQPSAPSGDDRYGINFVNQPTSPIPAATRYQQATSAGARWTRWPMYWADIETTQGNRNYAPQDAIANADAASGIQSHVILMATPSWASTSGSVVAPYPKVGERTFQPLITPQGVQLSSAISPPKNLYLAWNDPNNYWGQFVYATVSRYKDRVKVWEMWNEPDGTSPAFWSGTANDYYRLLKVGYQAAKAADPQSTVLFAGLAYWGNQNFFPSVLSVAASDPEGRGSGFFFDVLPWHPYIDPYYVYDWAQRARSQMQSALGLTKPVWVNETGVPVCGEWPTSCSPSDTWRATLDEQGAYVMQAYAYAFAAGIDRLSIFQLYDDGLAPAEYYGIFTNGAVPRPAYTAYQVASTYLARPTRVTRSPGNGYELITLEGTPQGKVTIAWATTGSNIWVPVAASSTSAKLINQYGSIQTITPSGGNYGLTLPGATNNRDPSGRYIIGGKPLLLVEPVLGSLSSQVSALPASSPNWSFAVSWSRLDSTGIPAVFDIQYKDGTSSNWTDWLIGTTQTSATFGPNSPVVVQSDHTYYFQSRLRNATGAEPYPGGDGDTHTIVSARLASQVNPLSTYATGRSFAVSWSRQDGSALPATFDIQYRVGTSPNWTDWLIGTTQTAATFGPTGPVSVQDGQAYYFRSRLRDAYGRTELYPSGDGDTHTTVPWFLTGKVTDNRDIGIVGATVSALGTSYSTTTNGGNFTLALPPGTYDLAAGLNGYGSLPSKHLSVAASLTHNFVLPPANFDVQNWGFEGTGGVNDWWIPGGQVATVTDWVHTGAQAAQLGEAGIQSDASLSQASIFVPTGTYRPTVSFLYAVPSAPGAGDTFFLDVTSDAGTTTYQIPLDTQGTWAHKWFPLDDISGNVTLNFRLHKASADQLRVYLDEVSLGKASGGPNVFYFPLMSK